jgi:hypothetical protein
VLDEKKLADLTCLVFFLFHMEREQPRAMYGSHYVSDAFDAVARLLGSDPDKLRVRLETEH